MKSLTGTIKNKHGKLKKSCGLTLFIVVLLFPLSLQAQDTQQSNTASPKADEVLSKAINDKATPDKEFTPPTVNATFVGEKTESESNENNGDKEQKTIQNNFILKFVKVPEDQRTEVKINLKKNYKKTDISDQPEDTYQRSVIKQINSALSEQELMTNVNDACNQYPPNKRKNYNIYLFDEKTGKSIGKYNCGKL